MGYCYIQPTGCECEACHCAQTNSKMINEFESGGISFQESVEKVVLDKVSPSAMGSEWLVRERERRVSFVQSNSSLARIESMPRSLRAFRSWIIHTLRLSPSFRIVFRSI